MKRRLKPLTAALLAAVLLIAGWLLAVRLLRSPLTTGPMVQMLTETGFTLVFQADLDDPPVIRLAERDGPVFATHGARLQGDRFVAVVDGLDPDAPYRYEIVTAGDQRTAGRLLARGAVRTAPAGGSPFRFLAFGDSGDGRRPQMRLARRMPAFEPHLVIHTGDLIYSRGEAEHYPSRFFRPYATLLASAAFYPCLGNHDVRTDDGRPFLDTFILPDNGPDPGGDPHHYWFDFGDARFVALDSNPDFEPLRDVVAPWLDGVLEGAADRWRIVFFHEPVYTNSRHPPADKLLKSVLPVIDRHRVHLVLAGHNHLYERTHPIRDGRVVPPGEGTVHVTTGAGGARLYEQASPVPDYMAAWHDASHSFTVADVTSSSIELFQVDASGNTVDRHRIPREAPAVRPEETADDKAADAVPGRAAETPED